MLAPPLPLRPSFLQLLLLRQTGSASSSKRQQVYFGALNHCPCHSERAVSPLDWPPCQRALVEPSKPPVPCRARIHRRNSACTSRPWRNGAQIRGTPRHSLFGRVTFTSYRRRSAAITCSQRDATSHLQVPHHAAGAEKAAPFRVQHGKAKKPRLARRTPWQKGSINTSPRTGRGGEVFLDSDMPAAVAAQCCCISPRWRSFELPAQWMEETVGGVASAL